MKRQRRANEKSVPSSGRRPSISPVIGQSAKVQLPIRRAIYGLVGPTRHENQTNLWRCWTKSQMSVMGFGRGRRRIGDPFGRHQARASPACAGSQLIGECMRRRVFGFKSAVLRRLAVPGLGSAAGSWLRAWPRAARFPHRIKPAANAPVDACRRCPVKASARIRRIRRGDPGDQWPCRQSRMRLARPPRRGADVARRSRHRVPSPRSLRPVRLPRRSCAGDVPLSDQIRRLDRSESCRQPSTAASMAAGSIRMRSRSLPR